RGFGPHVGLSTGPEGKQRVLQLLLGEHTEHVGLVLPAVRRTVQLDLAISAALDARIVTGRHGVEAQGHRAIQDGSELDLLVAPQAGIRRAAADVLGNEVIDHVLVEPLAQIPYIERDSDDVSSPARIVRIFESATPAGTGTVGLRVARQGQMYARHVMAGV